MLLRGLHRIKVWIAAVDIAVEALVAAQPDDLGGALDTGQGGRDVIATAVLGLQRGQCQPHAGRFQAATLPAVVEQRLQQFHALLRLVAQAVLQVPDRVILQRQRRVGMLQRPHQVLRGR
ncbi:hypothetical protein G6F50_017793 [Rhizopus delemar]|uniref:Secreted protein n=1 Tax=Rhizopus delemar TaxID=936053 RepID=A0A9P6XP68_9FUNG|nr:hypothetical protein G6F50_017793 [Rhizopus delemar]